MCSEITTYPRKRFSYNRKTALKYFRLFFHVTVNGQSNSSFLRPGQTRMRVDESWQSCDVG